MESLYKEFYYDMLNSKKEIGNFALDLDVEFTEFKSEEELINYVAKLLKKNGGRKVFTILWSNGKLDLSIEALVLKDKYKSLFNEEIKEQSRKILYQYGYKIS